VLGVRRYVVRGLVEKGLLTIAAGDRHGLSKLIPEKEVQRFTDCYVPAAIVAKGLNLSACSYARYLRQSSTPLLAVPIPMRGRVMRCFYGEIPVHFDFRLPEGRGRSHKPDGLAEPPTRSRAGHKDSKSRQMAASGWLA